MMEITTGDQWKLMKNLKIRSKRSEIYTKKPTEKKQNVLMKKTKQSYPLSRLLFFFFSDLIILSTSSYMFANVMIVAEIFTAYLKMRHLKTHWGGGGLTRFPNPAPNSNYLHLASLEISPINLFLLTYDTECHLTLLQDEKRLNWHSYWIDIWIFLFNISIWIDISTSVQLISASTISPSTIATNSFKSHA